MILNYFNNVKGNHQGSSFLLPAHGTGGARATINNYSPSSSEKFLAKPESRRAKRKGVWGKEFLPACRSEAPPPCSFRAEVSKKSFLFLLEEKIGRPQNKKCEENFFAGQRAKRAAAGRSKFAVRIFVKKGSDFNQKVPPIRIKMSVIKNDDEYKTYEKENYNNRRRNYFNFDYCRRSAKIYQF